MENLLWFFPNSGFGMCLLPPLIQPIQTDVRGNLAQLSTWPLLARNYASRSTNMSKNARGRDACVGEIGSGALRICRALCQCAGLPTAESLLPWPQHANPLRNVNVCVAAHSRCLLLPLNGGGCLRFSGPSKTHTHIAYTLTNPGLGGNGGEERILAEVGHFWARFFALFPPACFFKALWLHAKINKRPRRQRQYRLPLLQTKKKMWRVKA